MTPIEVTGFMELCKEHRQLIYQPLRERLQTLLHELSKLDFKRQGNTVGWELWYEENGAWYQVRVAYKYGRVKLLLNNVEIVETGVEDEGTTGDISIDDFLDWILAAVRQDVALIQEGSYAESVLMKIPQSCRTGILYRETPLSVFLNVEWSSLDKDELLVFYDLRENGYRMCNRPSPDLTLEDIFHVFAKAAAVCGWTKLGSMTEREIFLTFAKTPQTEVLEKMPELSIGGWMNLCGEDGGEMYTEIFMDRSVPVGLDVCHDEEGYFLKVICNDWSYTDDAIRIFLVMLAFGLPVWLPNARQIQDRLEGIERVAILPENNICRNPALLFPKNTVAAATALWKDVQGTENASQVVWDIIAEPHPIGKIGAEILSQIIK
jgi:hypothetical protein